MALANRVKVTTTTTGTGALTLSATGVRDATNGDCLAPAEMLSELGGRTVSYVITSGASFAYGQGQLSSNGLTLTRDPREVRWNGTTYSTAMLSLAGTSTVMITALSADIGAGRRGRTMAAARGVFTGG